jgi:hypothetical protein
MCDQVGKLMFVGPSFLPHNRLANAFVFVLAPVP